MAAGSRAEGASWEAHASVLILDVWEAVLDEFDAAVGHAFHRAGTGL